MFGIAERFFVVFLAALVAYALTYAHYRRTSAAFWSYASVWLFEIAPFIAFITGAQNTQFFDLFMHAFGVPVIAALLVVADILLIELSLVAALRPLSFVLPKQISALLKVEDTIKTLQKYHALPKPERLEAVFAAAVIGGLVNLALLFIAGAFT
ncbi:MAG: hypothetical protein FJY76_03015 [Candidatus Aenigmarchaeota archaeon]|nr:hypothetical protein [Candidatus Aenigmarchaeota archaeon]